MAYFLLYYRNIKCQELDLSYYSLCKRKQNTMYDMELEMKAAVVIELCHGFVICLFPRVDDR